MIGIVAVVVILHCHDDVIIIVRYHHLVMMIRSRRCGNDYRWCVPTFRRFVIVIRQNHVIVLSTHNNNNINNNIIIIIYYNKYRNNTSSTDALVVVFVFVFVLQTCLHNDTQQVYIYSYTVRHVTASCSKKRDLYLLLFIYISQCHTSGILHSASVHRPQ